MRRKEYRLRDEHEGRIVRYDLLTNDLDSAKTFSRAVVGWEPFPLPIGFTTLDVWRL